MTITIYRKMATMKSRSAITENSTDSVPIDQNENFKKYHEKACKHLKRYMSEQSELYQPITEK
jgi:hypothetical protein